MNVCRHRWPKQPRSWRRRKLAQSEAGGRLEDLTDTCKPGDDVTVIGVVINRWRSLGRGEHGITDIELAINANYLKVTNDQSADGRRISDDHIKLIYHHKIININ